MLQDLKKEKELMAKEQKKREKMIVKAQKEKGRLEAAWRDENQPGEQPSAVFVTKTGAQKVRPLVLADTIQDLPQDVHESIQRMKIPVEDIEKNFQIFLNILTFSDKKRPKRIFRTRKYHEDKDAALASDSRYKPPRMILEEDEILPQMTLKQAKKLFTIGKSLGQGAFGQVFEAKASKAAKLPCKTAALKIIKHDSDKQKRMNITETSIVKFCSHPSICALYMSFRVADEAWVVMEFMAGGTLMEAAAARYGDFNEAQIAYVAREMLEGIKYLHENQLAHRDLKNLNVMLTTNAEVKIIDFGLCSDMSSGPRIQMVGSPFWMAPEMIRGEPHSYPVDIWSFAICMLELANRKPPNVTNVKRAMFLVATVGLKNNGLEEPEKWSEAFKDFLAQGMVMDQSQRPTAQQLLEHKFLKEAATREVMIDKMTSIFLTNGAFQAGLV